MNHLDLWRHESFGPLAYEHTTTEEMWCLAHCLAFGSIHITLLGHAEKCDPGHSSTLYCAFVVRSPTFHFPPLPPPPPPPPPLSMEADANLQSVPSNLLSQEENALVCTIVGNKRQVS